MQHTSLYDRITKPFFNFSISRYRFAPSLLSILLLLLLLPFLIRLGVWQLQRADEKRHLQIIYLARSTSAPVNLADPKILTGDLQFYPATATGFFDNNHQLLLDNKIYQHQVGYEVLTPFILNSAEKTILVNRGWIPQGKSRNILPVIKPITGEVTIMGVITVPSTKNFSLSKQIETNSTMGSSLIQQIDLKQVAALTHANLLPFVLLLNADQQFGFTRDWSPMNLKVGMHYGYAFQWFSLAATLFLIFIIVNTKRETNY